MIPRQRGGMRIRFTLPHYTFMSHVISIFSIKHPRAESRKTHNLVGTDTFICTTLFGNRKHEGKSGMAACA